MPTYYVKIVGELAGNVIEAIKRRHETKPFLLLEGVGTNDNPEFLELEIGIGNTRTLTLISTALGMEWKMEDWQVRRVCFTKLESQGERPKVIEFPPKAAA